MAGLTARRRYNKTPQRRKIPGVGAQTFRGSRTPIGVVSISEAMSVVTVTFDQPVQLGPVLPGWTATAGAATVVSVAQFGVAGNVFKVTFSEAPTGEIDIPFEDPGFRNSAGGYVRDSSIPIS